MFMSSLIDGVNFNSVWNCMGLDSLSVHLSQLIHKEDFEIVAKELARIYPNSCYTDEVVITLYKVTDQILANIILLTEKFNNLKIGCSPKVSNEGVERLGQLLRELQFVSDNEAEAI